MTDSKDLAAEFRRRIESDPPIEPRRRDIVLEELISRAETMFVYNSGATDEELIASIRAGRSDMTTRQRIKTHRKTISQMPSMSDGAQILFLSRQIQLDRFYSDWSEWADSKNQQGLLA